MLPSNKDIVETIKKLPHTDLYEVFKEIADHVVEQDQTTQVLDELSEETADAFAEYFNQ